MITVKVATENDIPRILEIADDAISPAWTRLSMLDRLGREDSVLFVAVDDGEGQTRRSAPTGAGLIVGFAAFRQVGDDGELLQIAVDAKRRRRGAGSMLLDAVFDNTTEKGLASIILEVRESNAAAVCFYEKHGFRQVRVRRDYYSNPTEDAVVMARGLP